MPTPKIKSCNTCGAPIYWSVDVNTGKKCPIDAEPVAHGNVILKISPRGQIKSQVLKKGETGQGAPLRLNHWVTCTNPPVHKGGTPA